VWLVRLGDCCLNGKIGGWVYRVHDTFEGLSIIHSTTRQSGPLYILISDSLVPSTHQPPSHASSADPHLSLCPHSPS